MNIGKTIKLLRIRNNIKQTDLVEATGLSKSYVSLIESGKKIPRLDQLELICKALGIHMSVLFLSAIDIENLDEEGFANKDKDQLIDELQPLVRKVSTLLKLDTREILDSSKHSKNEIAYGDIT